MTDTTTLTLTAFLEQRIAEDEAAARAVESVMVTHHPRWRGSERVTPEDPTPPFLPARVLAECEAKRRIVAALAADEGSGDESEGGRGAHFAKHQVCIILAAIYASHPDYNPDWT